jgi:hypothetical protein
VGRKIAVKTFRIVHDGLQAIRQCFVEVEENRLRHEIFLRYDHGEATEPHYQRSQGTMMTKALYP